MDTNKQTKMQCHTIKQNNNKLNEDSFRIGIHVCVYRMPKDERVTPRGSMQAGQQAKCGSLENK
jgi:hypothetical protein